jgi:polar amino acid transport system ATP-binding protein
MTDPIITFDGVSKSFAGVKVLTDLSFSVGSGERLALIGPSGSGKTTILRTLMTLEPIDSGTIVVDGENLWQRRTNGGFEQADEAHLRKMRAKIGMVFQLFNLFPHMTVLRNVTIGPILVKNMPRKEAEDLAYQLLQMVGMAEKSDAKPAQLSGGQKQRVAIARALALNPKIMLFDEVTSALDPELVEEVLNVLRKLGQDSDMTMLLVTHEMSFAHDFADRILFLDGGNIVESGPPDVIFSAPSEERTKIFLKKIIAAGLRI